MLRASLRLLLVVGALLLSVVHAPATDTPRPNFVVILCDDLGYGDLHCFGHPTIRTPHLDRLATQGMRFTDCYSASPVCSPSRAGLLTGRTPDRAGVYDWIPEGSPMHLRREETTLPKLLRTAGYATCHVGKWHLNGLFGSAEQPQPGDHGFDYWFSTQNNAAPSHENPDNFIRNGEKVGQLQGYSCQLVADEAIGWLERRSDRQQPFFLFVCFHEPHEPIASPAELVAEYPAATKRGQALYYANVTNMDRAVGRLMASLDQLKLANQTLVYFSSDNGPETLDRYPDAWRSHGSSAPLRDRKLYLYEGGIRVPGIARWPGHIKPGQEVHESVCSLDLLPTFCALAGAQVPDGLKLDGADIRPVLAGESFERPSPLYWHYFRALGQPKATLRVGNYTLLAHSDRPNQRPVSGMPPGAMQALSSDGLKDFELYDLASDLGQGDDLAQREPERVKELSERLLAKYREIQSQMPVWPDWQPKKKAAGK